MTAPEAALEYARRGWRVFPVRGKAPLTDHGCLEASAEPEIIERWWRRWPEAGVAIKTGIPSGLVVFDVDPRHDGEESLHELEARYGPLPDTAVSLTGGEGTHSLFAHPGPEVSSRTGLVGFRGIDLKADGSGYIVAPPSVHPNGRAYAWNVHLHPDDVPLATCPEWILELAERGPAQTRASYQPADWSGRLPARASRLIRLDARVRARFRRQPGEHHDRSPSGIDHSLAYLLARRGLAGAEIEAAIRASRARAGLPERATPYYGATVGKALAAAREK